MAFPILIVAPPTPREAVLFSGVVRRLVDEIQDARFVVVGDAAVTTLYRDLPGLDRLVPLQPAPLGLHWLRLWLRFRGRRWGLVLDLAGSPLGRSIKGRRRALRKPLSPSLGPLHKVVEAAHVLRVDDDPPAPFLFVGEETEAAAEALMRPAGGRAEGPILALAPSAEWVGKTWPAERFAVFAAELLGPSGPLAQGRLMIVGGAEDRWAAEAVRRTIARDRLIDIAGKADLLTTYACLRRARLFVGNDTVMTDLAAAAGVPTLGLFGPSDERVWGPWGPRAEALRGPRDLDTIRRADPGLNQAVCHMQDLPVAWVSAAARRLLAGTEEPEPSRPDAAADQDAADA